ncbi:MAG TPA: hypothetical protein VMS73_07130 [Anaerolineaceae bacterium]|nr:hypothetical protein [Anaerolineaceae bacterium]
MKGKTNSSSFVVKVLILLLVLLAVGALFGGGAFLLAPDGRLIEMPISHLKNSPFKDFLIPGIFLFTFLGLYPAAVAYSLWKRLAWRWPDAINPFRQFHWSWAATLAAGVIVLIWITVEMVWVPFGIVHVVYLVWGALLLALALLPGVRRYCSRAG